MASVVISNLYINGVSAVPSKADAILVVDCDGPLTLPVTLKRVQFVARRRLKVGIVASLAALALPLL